MTQMAIFVIILLILIKLNKKIPLFLAIFICWVVCDAQPDRIHGLQQELSICGNDSAKVRILDSLQLTYLFYSYKPDSSFYYINQLVSYGFKRPDKKALVLAYSRMGFYYVNTAHYKAALDISLQGIRIAEEFGIPDYLSSLYYNLAWVYLNVNDYRTALGAAFSGKTNLVYDQDHFLDESLHLSGLAGNVYLGLDKPDSALYYFNEMASEASRSKETAAADIADYYWGMYFLNRKSYPKADSFLVAGTHRCEQNHDFLLNSFHLFLAQSLLEQGRIREAVREASLGMLTSRGVQDKDAEASGASLLNSCYDRLGKRDSAYYFLKISDSLNAIVKTDANAYDIQQINFRVQLGKQEESQRLVIQNEKSRNRTVTYVFLTALVFFVVIVLVQWRNNVGRKKANVLLREQKQQVESTLTALKSTQLQLIQAEKMASLGELTAGIAHEIQNPLNFVNNFSEVNKELFAEMNVEMAKGNFEQAKAIAKDIEENQEKINVHGRRADAIVKGMLEHSRSGAGIKEPANINAIAADSLKLSYQAVRSKDKSFEAVLQTDFDDHISNVPVVHQDMVRVLVNLFNNAFYAVKEKKSGNLSGFQGVVSLTTRKINDKLIITVADNGNGIPSKIIDKIFQPFFTTKPAGMGTGLGLSLSYDIIKAHGGEIKAESNNIDGTKIIIELPVG
jgi:two-component system, NtrC family, sensor kinase